MERLVELGGLGGLVLVTPPTRKVSGYNSSNPTNLTNYT